MQSNSSVTIVDSNGNSTVIAVGSAVPAGGVMVMGSDGTLSRFISTDTSGRTVVVGAGVAGTPAGGVLTIQGVAGGTAIPISGSITATNPSVGTTGSAIPTSSTLVGGSDGTNLVALKMKPASTAAVASDPALVVAISPNNKVGVISQVANNVVATGIVYLPVAGLSDTGNINALALTAGGALKTSTASQSQSVQSAVTLTTSGTNGVNTAVYGNNVTFDIEVAGPVTGAGATLVYTLREIAVDGTTTVQSTSVTITAAGVYRLSLNNLYGAVSTTWTVTGTTPSFGGVSTNYIQNPGVIINGTGTIGQKAPTDAIMMGASDGTNLVGARIKAASTAAVATDPALVVAISPNNPISVSGTADATATGALGALNAAVQIATAGLKTVGFQLAAGTLIGTLVPEVSFDGGTTWNATYFDTLASGKVATIVFGSANVATAATIVGVGGSGLSRVRVSAWTSGTANITVRATTRDDPSSLHGGPVGLAAPINASYMGGTDGTNLIGLRVTPANTAALVTDPALIVAISPNSPSLLGLTSTSYSPNIGNSVLTTSTSQVAIDASSRLETHSSVTTDEGSFRDDFSGAAISSALTGTVNFVNGSLTLTGTGTAFTTQVREGDWIKKSADAETLYVEVDYVESDTSIVLLSAYTGTTASVASVVSGWDTNTAATGGSITLANSLISLVLGTTSGQSTYIQRNGDYGPYSFLVYPAISQRIANQTAAIGFRDNWAAPNKRCEIQFTGTDNTKVNFVTASGSAAADIQTTTVSLPNLGVTSGYHTYKIDLVGNQAMLQVDGVVLATHTTHLPGPYDVLSIFAGITNTGTAGSSTTLNVDSIFFYNTDQLQINTDFQGKPLAIKAVDGATLPVFLTDPTAAPAWPTPFGDLRVVSPWVLADLVNKYEIDPRVYGTSTATGGTVTFVPLASAIALAATATINSAAKLRTNNYFRYQAGKSLRWRTTLFHTDTGQTNQVRRWGFFDDNDGLFFALTGTVMSVVQRSSVSGGVVEVAFTQANWNFDRMDGYGPSGMTLDITKGNIYECAFQWLGVGNVLFFVNGRLVHINRNPGLYASPYMRTATLPLSWEVVNTGASTIGGFTYICSNVFIEGGEPAAPTSFAAFTASDVLTSPAEHPIISIRPKATYNSITNRMLLLPFILSVSTEGSRAGYRVVMNSTLTGASWVSADANSGAEYDLSASSGTGGQTLIRGFLPGSNDAKDIDLTEFFSEKAHGRSLHLDAFAATQDVITLYAVNEGVGNTNIRASIAWNEIR